MSQNKQVFLSTERRIILVFAVSALASIVLVGAALQFFLLRTELAQTRINLQARAALLARQCESEITEARLDLEFLARTPAFQQLQYTDQIDRSINGVPENVEVEKRHLLTQLMNKADRFSVIYVLKPNADIYVLEPFRIQTAIKKYNLADRPYYQEATQTRRTVISDGFLGSEGILASVVLVPIFTDAGDIKAYLGGVFHLSRLSQWVGKEQIKPFDAGFLVDRQGDLIAHTDTAMLQEGVREHFIKRHPLVAEFFTSKGRAAKQEAVFLGEYASPADNKPHLSVFVPLRMGWSLVLMRNRASVIAEIRPVIWGITSLVGLLLALIGGLGVLIAHGIGQRWDVAERALRESEERFRLANLATFNAIWDWDLQTNALWWNENFKALFGYRAEEIEPGIESWTSRIHPADLGRLETGIHAAIDSGQQYWYDQYRFRRKDGKYADVEDRGYISRDAGGKPMRMIGAMQDITERKRAEEALVIQKRIDDIFLTIPDEKMYNEVLKVVLNVMQSPYGVFGYIDEDGANVVPSMTRHIWDKCQVPDKTFTFPRDTWGDSSWPQAIREKKVNYTNELSTLTPKGHILVQRHISLPILFQDEVIGLLQVANKETDYTEADISTIEALSGHIAPILSARLKRERAEKEIRRLNADLEQRVLDRTAQLEAANKELEAFSYSVSHDLRSPLRAIEGFSRIVTDDYADKMDAEGNRLLKVIRFNTKKMDQLITDLLVLSRVSRTGITFSRIDMTALARSIYHEIASHEVQEIFDFSVSPLPDAQGDSTLMRQVWSNLLSNAIKFTMPKDKRKIEIGSRTENNMNIYFAKDSGVGFNPIYAHKLFGVFQRLHKTEEFEGTGVGLAIVQRVIHRHGGQVWAEGKINEGATFYFSLPKKYTHD